ncbi:MAG: L-glutamate gamma-semialdehyde dehydrogenase [Planctomycetes bacterium]|nr:L-glutamate gamma-semialdehyde dehydrogenase [Planctomycetota bacterium]NOG54231.1 L-glutamate gamma-semialdehyde dehydrogenase [Planctomycetota bacterium]
MSLNAINSIPTPANEPVHGYLPGSPERAELKAELKRQLGEKIDIPLIINGKEIRTGKTKDAVIPHDHGHVLGTVHLAGEGEVKAAVDACMKAHGEWSRMPYQDRAGIFLRAAELLAGPWRARINAATMLNQSKTCHQAEIDAACELIDFFRFNAWYMTQIYEQGQPPISPTGLWNRVEFRPLEGFVYSITPFNFTSIAGNLPTAPALMGTTSIWKPSHSAQYSAYLLMKMFEEAGVPDGVLNMVCGPSAVMSEQLFADYHFGGVHYTGSTSVFRDIWKTIGQNMPKLKDYPRIVGETGGKDYIVAHPSSDRKALVAALVRGAFEYQGQKCSAASRAYIARSVWDAIKDELVAEVQSITMGDVCDFSNFMGSVIHQNSLDKCRGFIGRAKESSEAEVIVGGECDDSKGFFVQPTVILTTNPKYESMVEEIFAPILTIYVYDDADFSDTLHVCDQTSEYALTGAIFSNDRAAVLEAMDVLRYSAGNFYINDKPTGAVVGQQPFGGGRASGTNDKAGSYLNLLRWVTPRTIKENFNPPRDYRYGFLNEA